jgi:peptidoglycan hydrolase-like protein with peptidoglycan-binding domain
LFGGAMALLANPVWADGGSYGHDKNQNQAGQERIAPSQAKVDRLEEQQIKQLQQALQERGLEPGNVDGVMGPQTRQALAKFQRDNNLEPTGSLNERTAQHLGLEFAEDRAASGDSMNQQERDEVNQSRHSEIDNTPAS